MGKRCLGVRETGYSCIEWALEVEILEEHMQREMRFEDNDDDDETISDGSRMKGVTANLTNPCSQDFDSDSDSKKPSVSCQLGRHLSSASDSSCNQGPQWACKRFPLPFHVTKI